MYDCFACVVSSTFVTCLISCYLCDFVGVLLAYIMFMIDLGVGLCLCCHMLCFYVLLFVCVVFNATTTNNNSNNNNSNTSNNSNDSNDSNDSNNSTSLCL